VSAPYIRPQYYCSLQYFSAARGEPTAVSKAAGIGKLQGGKAIGCILVAGSNARPGADAGFRVMDLCTCDVGRCQGKDQRGASNREGNQATVELDHRVVFGGGLVSLLRLGGRLHRFVGDDPTK